MLELYATTSKNNVIRLGPIISLTVNQEENVPADDLSVTLLYDSALPELDLIELKEDGETLFKGVVDEQQAVVNQNGAYNRIAARSLAALLLDNESEPVSYYQPSTSVIFKNHIEPFGIKSYKGKNKAAKEALNIPKGATNWQAVEAFGKKAYGKSPRVEHDGSINFNGLENDCEILFSNVNGIAYNSVKENKKRCKLLSDVRVKLKPDSGYDLIIENEKSGLIKRERYVDASVASATPYIASAMIENGNAQSYELELTSPERLLNILGAKAFLDCDLIDVTEALRVTSVYYRLTPESELTIVKLKKEN